MARSIFVPGIDLDPSGKLDRAKSQVPSPPSLASPHTSIGLRLGSWFIDA